MEQFKTVYWIEEDETTGDARGLAENLPDSSGEWSLQGENKGN